MELVQLVPLAREVLRDHKVQVDKQVSEEKQANLELLVKRDHVVLLDHLDHLVKPGRLERVVIEETKGRREKEDHLDHQVQLG